MTPNNTTITDVLKAAIAWLTDTGTVLVVVTFAVIAIGLCLYASIRVYGAVQHGDGSAVRFALAFGIAILLSLSTVLTAVLALEIIG